MNASLPPPRSLISAEPVPAALGGGIALGCDCGTTTHLVVEVEGTLKHPREVGVTCDGCLTTHWVTVCPGENAPAAVTATTEGCDRAPGSLKDQS